MAMSCAGWARKLVLGGGRGSANSFFRLKDPPSPLCQNLFQMLQTNFKKSGGGRQPRSGKVFLISGAGVLPGLVFFPLFSTYSGPMEKDRVFYFSTHAHGSVFSHIFQYIPGEWRSTGCFVFPPSHLQQTQSYEEVGFSPQVYQGTFPTRKCTQPRPQQGHFISPELEGLFRLLTWLNLSKFQTFIIPPQVRRVSF